MDTMLIKLDDEIKNYNKLNDQRKNLRNERDFAFVKSGK